MSKLPSKRNGAQWVTLFSNIALPAPTPAPLPQCYLCRQQRQCSETIMGDTCSPKGSKSVHSFLICDACQPVLKQHNPHTEIVSKFFERITTAGKSNQKY